MSRKKTARRVRRQRMFLRAFFVTLVIAALGTGGFLFASGFFGAGGGNEDTTLQAPYESRSALRTLETAEERPTLFGEGLCALLCSYLLSNILLMCEEKAERPGDETMADTADMTDMAEGEERKGNESASEGQDYTV